MRSLDHVNTTYAIPLLCLLFVVIVVAILQNFCDIFVIDAEFNKVWHVRLLHKTNSCEEWSQCEWSVEKTTLGGAPDNVPGDWLKDVEGKVEDNDEVEGKVEGEEQRMQVMAEDVGRKDNQLAAMLTKMHAKDKQMTELIMQVAAMKTGGRYTGNDNDDKSQGTRNSKRKAVDSVTGGGGGIGEGGARIKMRTVRGGWTHHSKFSFPVDQNAPFIAREIKWDSSWPAYKQAYHNARKAIQDAEAAKERAEKKRANKGHKDCSIKEAVGGP